MYEFANEKYTEIFTTNWSIWIRAGIPPLAHAQNEKPQQRGNSGLKNDQNTELGRAQQNQRVTKLLPVLNTSEWS